MSLPRFPVAMVIAMSLTASAHAQDGWLLFRGNPQRTGEASKLPAWEKRVAWQRPLLMDRLDGFPDIDPEQLAKDLIEKLRKEAAPTILPGSFPIIVEGICIYRGYTDLRCVAMQEIRVRDIPTGQESKIQPSAILWKSLQYSSSLAPLLEKNRTKSATLSMVDILREKKQEHLVWSNSTIGALASDGKIVISIDDFAFPPIDPKPPIGRPISALKSHVFGNGLRAFDAPIGRLMWEAGRGNVFDEPLPFARTFFLGAPLFLDGKSLVLNEKDSELRLVVMGNDPKKGTGEPELEKTLSLTKIPAGEQILKSLLRRTQPLHLAYADGLLVCPTHAGVLFGVDRAKMAVRWQYRYRDEKTPVPALPHWQSACPVIYKDRIVFTAADAAEIHCLNLKGEKQWVAPADKDLYLATVHDDIVLLVGKTHCRALKLADGAVKWTLETGLPAGVGVKAGSHYYLPLKRADGPTIWAIDLDKGKKARAVNVPYPDALGNLILHRGMFVSQSVTHIAAFSLK